MNEKCKYCDYVSKCSRKCEYGSILCTVNRSFPKIVDKSYEELQQENQQLKEQLKQRDEVIDEIYDYIQDIIDNPVKYSTKNNVEAIFNIVRRYKGDRRC